MGSDKMVVARIYVGLKTKLRRGVAQLMCREATEVKGEV